MQTEGIKVAFCDVDGVFNSLRTVLGTGRTAYRFIEEQRDWLDWIAIGLMRRLVEDYPDLKFVLSSTWRIDGSRTPAEVAAEAGAFLGLPFIDCTDTGGPIRGAEIQRWLDAHPEVTNYVIIDDDSDMLESQAPHFVQTLYADGVRFCHFLAMKRILGGELGGLYRRERFWEMAEVPCTDSEFDESLKAGFHDACPNGLTLTQAFFRPSSVEPAPDATDAN